MALRNCSAAHCSGADAELNEVCKQEGWAIGHPVITRDDQGPCQCHCSCLAHGTPVQAGDTNFKAIESFIVGDYVLASGRDLKWNPVQVVFSQGTGVASVQKNAVVIVYDSRFLAVTGDHLFLLPNGNLKRASRLTVHDSLMAPDGSRVAIDSIHIGDYTAGFHHIATSKTAPDTQLSGHLLNTNGVVSADYSLQLFGRSSDSRSLLGSTLDPSNETAPIIGSPEYVKKWGDSCLGAPALSTISVSSSAASFAIGDTRQPGFRSAKSSRLTIPEDACPFISEDEADQRALDIMRPWNDPDSREWTEYLLDHHRHFYPNIQFNLDWADNRVNAYAWVQNGVRHVAILGGLVRHQSLFQEAIALVIAHEVGHHYGGNPTHSSGLSCEGQADYYGVSVIMRRVWFGAHYIQVVDPGIAQMADFFGVPNNPTAPGGSAGCAHPPGACRVATYHAAVNLGPKPGCAS